MNLNCTTYRHLSSYLYQFVSNTKKTRAAKSNSCFESSAVIGWHHPYRQLTNQCTVTYTSSHQSIFVSIQRCVKGKGKLKDEMCCGDGKLHHLMLEETGNKPYEATQQCDLFLSGQVVHCCVHVQACPIKK